MVSSLLSHDTHLRDLLIVIAVITVIFIYGTFYVLISRILQNRARYRRQRPLLNDSTGSHIGFADAERRIAAVKAKRFLGQSEKILADCYDNNSTGDSSESDETSTIEEKKCFAEIID